MLRIWEMASLGTAAMALVLAVSPAQAAGCNGHVNAMEWGCAPWRQQQRPAVPALHQAGRSGAKTATPRGRERGDAYATGHAIQPRSGKSIGHDGGSPDRPRRRQLRSRPIATAMA